MCHAFYWDTPMCTIPQTLSRTCTAIKPAVQLLQIQEVHLVAHSSACNFAVFYLFFLPVLSRPSFTSRTPNKDQKIEQLFYFLLVQVL